jgi:AGCS family alanine or glycine:cation symporter
MGLLALVNLTAMFLLFKTGLRLMRDYDEQRKAGVESPVFDAKLFADLDLDPAAWPSKGNAASVDAAEASNLAHQR